MLNLKLDSLIRAKTPTLTLQGAEGPVSVGLQPDAPLLAVVGSPHSGKSVLALLLAEQLLKQDLNVIWFTDQRLFPGDDGYIEAQASRMAVRLENRYPDGFITYIQPSLQPDEVLICPGNSLVIIDDISLLDADAELAKRFTDWASSNNAYIVLVAERPEAFYRIGLTKRDTEGVSLMLIGHLDADQKHDEEQSLVRQRLASHRFLSSDHTEFLAITPKPLWSGIVQIHLPGQE